MILLLCGGCEPLTIMLGVSVSSFSLSKAVLLCLDMSPTSPGGPHKVLVG